MRYAGLFLVAMLLLQTPVARGGEAQKGDDAFQSADYETALAVWTPLAEAGDSDSQFGLGQMYGNGFGVTMDDALAIKWYELAAEQGHAQAQCNLAVMYQNGWGVPPSEEQAMKYYALAADHGNSESMVALGRFYSMDFLDSFDPVQAYKWFSIAYLLEDYDASIKLEAINPMLTPDQRTEAKALVDSWSAEHADLLASD